MSTNSTPQPSVGSPAPDFTLPDQNGTDVELASLHGQRVFLYFYPKAMTSGCTTQAVALRDARLDNIAVVGVSPDPVDRLRQFADQHQLGFLLLSDEDHRVAEAYGVWTLKKLYGREYMGIQRAAFLIGTDGKIEAAWPKISPKDTVPKLRAALA